MGVLATRARWAALFADACRCNITTSLAFLYCAYQGAVSPDELGSAAPRGNCGNMARTAPVASSETLCASLAGCCEVLAPSQCCPCGGGSSKCQDRCSHCCCRRCVSEQQCSQCVQSRHFMDARKVVCGSTRRKHSKKRCTSCSLHGYCCWYSGYAAQISTAGQVCSRSSHSPVSCSCVAYYLHSCCSSRLCKHQSSNMPATNVSLSSR